MNCEGSEKGAESLEEVPTEPADSHEFEDVLFFLRETQDINDGYRSHPRLLELDALRRMLTYEGWETDFDDAFDQHTRSARDGSGVFRRSVEKMKRKQCMAVGDYSHENLMFLQSLNLSFPGWIGEVETAVVDHKNGLDIDQYKFSLPERQRIFEGNRSHPRLVALDSLNLTYPGWEEDVNEAEKLHVGSIFCTDGMFASYKSYLKLLEDKQSSYEIYGKRLAMHPMQRHILDSTWSYPGWQEDVERIEAEDSTNHQSDDHYFRWFDAFQLRQMIHDKKYDHHPALMKLGQLQLSYPGWKDDFRSAEKCLVESGYAVPHWFDACVQGMKNKQAVYDGAKKDAHNDIFACAVMEELATCLCW
ncbi:hypothetical protein ACHAWF_016651 [Thalassiosira exigua]